MMVRAGGRRIGIWLAGVLIAVPLGSGMPPAASAGAEQAATTGRDDALGSMNALFRAGYQAARFETLRRLGPVILVRSDRLVLRDGDRRLEAPVTIPLYHALKAVAHVPLAIFVLLDPSPEGPLADDAVESIGDLRRAIVAARPELEASGFTPEQLTRQRDLLDRSVAFIDGLLARKAYTRADLDAFARGCGPIVLANATEAARLQIETYDRSLEPWRKAIAPARWKELRVVVIGRQMPRKGNLAVQYFARLLGVAGEGPRLVYAEELSGDEAALDLLGTHLLDRRAAEAFFGDPERLERDLLSDGAAEVLRSRKAGE